MTAIDTWGKAEIPTILYKYKPLDKEGYTMKILTDGEIYFPSISKLNDPFEGDIPYIFDTNELTSDNIFLAMRKIAKESNPEMTEEELHEYLLGYTVSLITITTFLCGLTMPIHTKVFASDLIQRSFLKSQKELLELLHILKIFLKCSSLILIKLTLSMKD